MDDIGSDGCVTSWFVSERGEEEGAVSPATRATDSMIPVTIPLFAAGTTMDRIVRARVAPRPSDASRSEFGTRRSISSVVRSTMGIAMIPSAAPPASRRSACTATRKRHTRETDDHGRNPVQHVRRKRIHPTMRDVENSARKIPPAGRPARQSPKRSHHDQRADDGVFDSPSGFARGAAAAP